VHPKYAAQIIALLPSSARRKLVTVDGAGHDLSISHAPLIVDALVDLLAGAPASWKTAERAAASS
jgi:pimeloyl-ACP methyl ester carboxylesterase